MPELPEVETTRRCLEPDVVGHVIDHVDVRRMRMLRRQPRPQDFADRLGDCRVVRLRRHGKFLIADLDNDILWVTHLGMSGRVALVERTAPEAPHTNVVVRFAAGHEFRLVDPRTFGFVAAYTPEEFALSSIGRLGPDALTALPRSRELHSRIRERSSPVKALLLDQHIIAGLGNIYADEALHRASIHPLRAGSSITPDEMRVLRASIKATLAAGLKWGGTSLDDLAYLLPDGRAGEYVDRLRAYGREGMPCRRCGQTITKSIVRQRSTHWCPGCQV